MKRLFVLLWVVIAVVSCTQAEIEITSKGIELSDKTVVHYHEAGQGPVLILVHGLGASSESWRPSMLYLAKRYHVIAPDLHGYGKSDKPRADYSIAYHAAELNRFIDAPGVKKAALAGNSMGGWIAALTALDHPDKVSHLVLVASAGLKRDTLPPVDLNPATKEQMQALLADRGESRPGTQLAGYERGPDLASDLDVHGIRVAPIEGDGDGWALGWHGGPHLYTHKHTEPELLCQEWLPDRRRGRRSGPRAALPRGALLTRPSRAASRRARRPGGWRRAHCSRAGS